jgi:hypothetical protein
MVGELGPGLDARPCRRGGQELGVAGVVRAPLAGQDVGVDGLVEERVAELVPPLGWFARDDVRVAGLTQGRVEHRGVEGQHGGQAVVFDPATADRGHAQHELGLRREAREPRCQQIGEQRRHDLRGRLVWPDGRGAGQLLEEEGVALGALVDGLSQGRIRRRPEDRGQEGHGVGSPEAVQAQVGDARPALELGDEASQGMSCREVVAAVGNHHRQRRGRAGRCQVGDEVPRRPVGPVHVLDDQEHRAHLRQPLEDPLDRLQRGRLAFQRTTRAGVVAADEPEPGGVGPEDVGRRRAGR